MRTRSVVVGPTRASRVAAKRDLLEQAARDYYAAIVGNTTADQRQTAILDLHSAARSFVRAENGDD